MIIHQNFNYFKRRLKAFRATNEGRSWSILFKLVLAVFIGLKLLAWAVPLPERSVFRESASFIFDRDGKLLRAFTSADGKWRVRTPLAQISPELQKMLLAYEDRSFYRHNGVNPLALVRAMIQNLQSGKTVSGGSTLTMQIARMIEPKPRTWISKAIEIARAFQLEQRYSKRRLLEIYFNIAPYGGNIEGVAAAAWLYFGKEPSQLSYGEAALLAALPNSPTELRPDLFPERARKARNRVLYVANQRGVLSAKDYHEALAEEVPAKRQRLPFMAPHFCQEIQEGYPGEARIYTTLDLRLQQISESMLTARIQSLRSEGITNGAVIIIDNRSHELLAAVGSAGFFDREARGQVVGYRAPRSPGSALKPFVYALGLDQGIITPQHYLEDVPIDFSGGYTPENYDRKFDGMVSAHEALARSLNVPVVNLQEKLGDNGLYPLLRRINASTIAKEDIYGLTIGLGGCEVTLLELASLYAALANQGEYQLPRLWKKQLENPRLTIFSPGASYIVTEILTELRRPDLPACWEFTSLPRIAWKTGTSYGHRDAWSIGYNSRYTVGVWVGNFSGESRPGIIGAEAAAPLLFDIFNQIQTKQESWFKRPPGVKFRQVCVVSGQSPGAYCGVLVDELYLIDRSPQLQCELHQAYLLDAATGYRLPPHYASSRKTKEQIYIKWPARVAAWMEGNGYQVEKIPPLIPQWQQLQPGQVPLIRSPSAGYEYQLREGIDRRFQKICFEAAAANDVYSLYWFVDGKLLGKVKPGAKLFYLPVPGAHRVVCQDDQGRTSEVKLIIRE
jgi:penicillin-binding protein 1C